MQQNCFFYYSQFCQYLNSDKCDHYHINDMDMTVVGDTFL